MKRISYRYQNDMTYIFVWSLICSLIVLCVMSLIIGGRLVYIPIIIISGLITIISTLFAGLAPILNLRVIPDVLYIDQNELKFRNGERLNIDEIKHLIMHRIGFGEFESHYYEVLLNNSPNNITRKRKSIVIVERYHIKNLIFISYEFLNHLKTLGLCESKIKNGDSNVKTRLGFRNKFKK